MNPNDYLCSDEYYLHQQQRGVEKLALGKLRQGKGSMVRFPDESSQGGGIAL